MRSTSNIPFALTNATPSLTPADKRNEPSSVPKLWPLVVHPFQPLPVLDAAPALYDWQKNQPGSSLTELYLHPSQNGRA